MAVRTFAATVAEALAAPAAPGHWRHLLVDAAAFLGMVTRLPLATDRPATDLLTAQLVSDWRDCASPLLITLPPGACHHSTLSAWSSFAGTWRYANALTYLESAMDPDGLVTSLSRRLDVQLPDGFNALLRYFDNRVLAVLQQVLEPEQHQGLLQPATRWLYADRSGTACEIAVEDWLTDEAEDNFSLTLTNAQEGSLLEAAEVDAVIDQLLVQSHPTLLAMRPDQQHRVVSLALQQAAKYALSGNPDQVAYCNLALTYGAGFESQEPWQSLLACVGSGQVRFADGLHQLSEGGQP